MKIEGLTLPELRDLAESTVTVAAAYQAGVFAALREGPGDAGDIARRAGLDRRATEVLLPVLEELGLVDRDGDGRVGPTPSCLEHLCDPESERFAAGGLPLWLNNLRDWTRLGDVLRSGEPVSRGGAARDEESLRRFMAGMAAAPAARVERLVDLCLERAPDAGRVLDVGGGPGVMAQAFMERGLEATLLDTPETVEFVGREYGLAGLEKLHLMGGDFTEGPLPQGPFDIVLMSNVLHIYDPERNAGVVRRAAEVLAPGGVVAVAEFVRGRSGRAARFALVMLMRTEGGNTYTEGDFRRWMEEAGLSGVRIDDLDEDRQLVTGVGRG